MLELLNVPNRWVTNAKGKHSNGNKWKAIGIFSLDGAHTPGETPD